MSIPFSESYGFRQRSRGFTTEINAGVTSNIDCLISEERYITGLQIILQNQVFGDTMTLQVVDVNNILGYGAGAVLDEFGKNWNVSPDTACQGIIENPYPAKIAAGLYIRVVYTSTGQTNIKVGLNFFLHVKAS